MFFDEVNLEVEGGRGGNGAVSFHREKFIAHGPPDGGDGGNGGSVIFLANENLNTFRRFAGKKKFKAEVAGHGRKKNMHGKDGESLILEVPLGTLIYENDELLADLETHGERFVAAKGGRGGFGNSHFVSSTRQAPKFAEVGDVGQKRELRLEMQLVADVGLVGFPSAGKSTLISHVSAAKPKIGAYPFTTLVPNLGVVNLEKFKPGANQTFVIADMPGIIEGAAEGKGLGDKFLRHISRSALLVYVLDPYSYEGRSMSEQFKVLRAELEKHKEELAQKKYFIAINKIDAISPDERENVLKEFMNDFPNEDPRLISAASGEGLGEFMFELWNEVQNFEPNKPKIKEEEEVPLYIPKELTDDHSFTVKELYSVKSEEFQKPIQHQLISDEAKSERILFAVHGERIEQISRMTNTDQIEGVQRVYDVLKKMGIQQELSRSGAVTGDLVKIGPHIYEFHELK